MSNKPAFLFAANWKLNKNPEQTRVYFEEFENLMINEFSFLKENLCRALFFPPAYNWSVCGEAISRLRSKLHTNIHSNLQSRRELSPAQSNIQLGWGAQNIYCESLGAYTGENSGSVLKELGGEYALVGHSERRQIFKEEDLFLAKKIKYLIDIGLCPILCIGETLEERESKLTHSVLKQQITRGLQNVNPNTSPSFVIAYEPVWAIGTGKVANLEQIEDAHSYIKSLLSDLGFGEISVLYGGSVKPENSKEIASISAVNGFLVGGASLQPKSFLEIFMTLE